MEGWVKINTDGRIIAMILVWKISLSFFLLHITVTRKQQHEEFYFGNLNFNNGCFWIVSLQMLDKQCSCHMKKDIE